MPSAARCADLSNNVQRQIFRRYAFRQHATNFYGHILHLPRPQRLRRQHMLHLRCTNAMRQRAKSAMRRRMAVTAHNRHARLGAALLWPHDMHDAIVDIAHREKLNIMLCHVARQRFQLMTGVCVLNPGKACRLIFRGCIVIGNGERQLWPPHGATGLL